MIIDPYTWSRHRIETIAHVTSDTVAINLKRPVGYSFRAGQYAVVRITKTTGESYIRQYSFSSAPVDDTLELLIQHEPDGVVSNWFFDEAKPGDSLELSQPLGSFTLNKSSKRHTLLIAGRVGIAPFVSMMRSGHKNLSVLYSVKSSDQICFPELLKQHSVTIVQTDISPRISKTFLSNLLADKPVVYISGSKQFVDSITLALTELGTVAEDIKRELFTLQ